MGSVRSMGCACAVSVVVPTRNRSSLLARLVECLANQSGIDSFELIVVDDCSVDDTLVALEHLASAASFPIVVGRTARPGGAGAARNVGWRLARSPIVAFTDDDCRPHPRWLAELVGRFDRADIVQGRTTFDREEARGAGPFSQVVSVERFSGQFETSNVAYRRALIAELGGFDEHFEGDSYGEDVDLAWRAIERGARVELADGAIVVHDVKRASGLEEFVASVRAARRWRHVGRVLRDHPGYRRHRLWHDPFLAPAHPSTLLALGACGVALARFVRGSRSIDSAVLTAMIPWLVHRLFLEPRPGSHRLQVAVLPATFVVDAVETFTVVWSGVRYRTLVA